VLLAERRLDLAVGAEDGVLAEHVYAPEWGLAAEVFGALAFRLGPVNILTCVGSALSFQLSPATSNGVRLREFMPAAPANGMR
jgi:hypothetical protein